MSRGKGSKEKSIQRGAVDSTKRQRLLNDLLKYPDYKPIFTNSPLQADLEVVKEKMPVFIADRRINAPGPRVKRNQRVSQNTTLSTVDSRGDVFGQNIRLIRFLVCTRRKMRKSVILSKFKHKKGGMGKARKQFNNPIRTWESKIKC